MIVINKINFPIYGSIILISMIIGLLFNYLFLKKNKKDRNAALFIFLLFVYSFIGAVLFNYIVNYDSEILNIGLSSYGGAIGVCVCAFIFEKMDNSNGLYIKSAVLSLPLIYSISKLACFFAGCCYGMPYNGWFSVVYPDGLNTPLLPVQLLETTVFLFVFVICYFNNKNKYIVPITIMLSAFSKFVLDYFRYRSTPVFLSANQIVSIVFALIGIVLIIRGKVKKEV